MDIKNKPVINISKSDLVGQAAQFAKAGYRLVQICCTQTADFEVTYSFDKNYEFKNLRIIVPKTDPVLPSITGSYFCAFTYENEINELFGIRFDGLALDFKGTFYRKSKKTPFLRENIQASEN